MTLTAVLTYPAPSVGVQMGVEKPFRIELPDAERGRSPEDVLRFDKLKAELSNPRLALSKDQRAERLRQLAELETAHRIEAEKAWALAATEETAALAEARGEDVERGVRGQINVRSRDSLKNLLRAGKLTLEQHDAGIASRDAYESRGADVGSQLSNLSPGADHNNERFVMLRLQRAKMLQALPVIERGILVGYVRMFNGAMKEIEGWETAFRGKGASDPNVALQMFRAVCAQGLTVNSFGEGRVFDRHVLALARGLDVAHAVTKGG